MERVSSQPRIPPILERRAPVMHPEALWSVQSIAAWGDYEVNYVANVLVRLEGFPKPLRLVKETSHPRWRAGDIWEWAANRASPAS